MTRFADRIHAAPNINTDGRTLRRGMRIRAVLARGPYRNRAHPHNQPGPAQARSGALME